MTTETVARLGPAGLEVLKEVAESSDLADSAGRGFTDLALDTVSVEGFGPFRDKATYPLKDRGLVLLKGTNLDGGSDRYVFEYRRGVFRIKDSQPA